MDPRLKEDVKVLRTHFGGVDGLHIHGVAIGTNGRGQVILTENSRLMYLESRRERDGWMTWACPAGAGMVFTLTEHSPFITGGNRLMGMAHQLGTFGAPPDTWITE